MEKLPTIILPDGRKVEQEVGRGRSGERASNPSSRSSSGEISESGGFNSGRRSSQLSSRLSSPSGSSHLLVPQVSMAEVTAPGEGVPSLVRLASVRLRAHNAHHLIEDFYVKRLGMQLVFPSVSAEMGACSRSGSGVLSRCPSQHFPRSSGSDSSLAAATEREVRGGRYQVAFLDSGSSSTSPRNTSSFVPCNIAEVKADSSTLNKREEIQRKSERFGETGEQEATVGNVRRSGLHVSSSEFTRLGSQRIEEGRSCLLSGVKLYPCCAGFLSADRDFARARHSAALAIPARATAPHGSDNTRAVVHLNHQETPESAAAISAGAPHMGCFYNQGRHEFLLEVIPTSPSSDDVKPYEHTSADVFSRLAFSVADVNAAQVALSSHMIRTGNAAQFADVNFAVTCLDPANFRIRVLQRLSEYNFVRKDGVQQVFHRRTLSRLGSEDTPPLGSQPTFHHVELRMRDASKTLTFYQQGLQLRLISKQAMPDFCMTLYFLTTDPAARPPHQFELDSHGNRTWLWEQPFSCICLKEYTNDERARILKPYEELPLGASGFQGITFLCKKMNERDLCQSLRTAGIDFSISNDDVYGTEVYHLKDPEEVPLRIFICDDA